MAKEVNLCSKIFILTPLTKQHQFHSYFIILSNLKFFSLLSDTRLFIYFVSLLFSSLLVFFGGDFWVLCFYRNAYVLHMVFPIEAGLRVTHTAGIFQNSYLELSILGRLGLSPLLA